MNTHLDPVFNILLPELETAGIKYWVYGGVSIAAFAGHFIRTNIDVDTFVKDEDYKKVCSLLEQLCNKHGFKYWPQPQKEWRQKLYIGIDGVERLSVVTAETDNNKVKHLYGDTTKEYPLSILNSVERNIDNLRFFTSTDENIKTMFKDYLMLRKGTPKQTTKEKIKCDAKVLLTDDKYKELIGTNKIWN